MEKYEAWLEDSVIVESNEPTPNCPDCGGRMVLRKNSKTGQQFYGCSNYVRGCRGTRGYNPTPSSPHPLAPYHADLDQGREPRMPLTNPTNKYNRPTGTPNTPQNPSIPEKPKPANKGKYIWYFAKVINDAPELKLTKDSHLAVRQNSNGNFKFIVLSGGLGHEGEIPKDKVAQIIRSERNPATGSAFTFASPREILKSQDTKKGGINSPMLPDDKMGEEQKAIDQRFAQLMSEPDQSHMMINALAGSGKTTMLRHLAWKYGNNSQRWLYLVFNTKNRTEAKGKFPPWVEVFTTNSFLGNVIGSKDNIGNVPQTERIAELSKARSLNRNEEDEPQQKIEKIRIVADSPEFEQVLAQLGVPSPSKAAEYEHMGNISGNAGKLLASIRYSIKEEILTLANLAKSFALDPRNSEGLISGIENIFSKYDIDTGLSDIKERISKYSYSYQKRILQLLNEIFGYDFMGKDYKEEIANGAYWILKETMPHGTQLKHRHAGDVYDLGSFRDFNDDLWYAVTYADKIKWPRFDVVLADEVQDFNEAQKIMLQKLHQAGAKIVAVGDPNQSIYRFRGADGGAFNNIANSLTDLSSNKNVVYSLSKNWRSRKAIIDFANQATHVKNLQQGKVFTDGYDGEVTNREMKYTSAFDQLKSEMEEYGETRPTAFISRTNEPLVHAALKCLTENIPFVIVGKDIAQGLRGHMAKVMRMNGMDDKRSGVHELQEALQKHLESEESHYHGKSTKKAYLQDLQETTKALSAAINAFIEEKTKDQPMGTNQYQVGGLIGEFRQWINKRLGGLNVEESEKDLMAYQKKIEEENPVILTTSHRSKGLEFDRVFILRDDLFPHPKAERPEDKLQEENARYVAYTRAMNQLHILDLEGQPGYKEGGNNRMEMTPEE